MFSYRHAFHAGNHADVLKHSILLHVLDYFNRKEKPYWVIDTHAGAGIYDLSDAWANTTAEFHSGILRLWSAGEQPPLVQRYVDHVKNLNKESGSPEQLYIYPGSPWIALSQIRNTDRLRLFELHPTECEVLGEYIKEQERRVARLVAIYFKDGFTGIKALLPPPTHRAIILIDPSYEDKKDYAHVVKCIKESLARFATGCYMVWYPLAQRHELTHMLEQLKRQGKDYLNAQLVVKKPPKDHIGLYGSGMFIINPPYTLKAALEQALPYLTRTLAQDEGAYFDLSFELH